MLSHAVTEKVMVKKNTIKRISLRFYEGEEDLVQVLANLDDSVIVNEYLKGLIRDALVEKKTKSPPSDQPAPVNTEALAKELLPQIRRVIEAALESHTINAREDKNGEMLNEDTQEMIQEGLKKLGQSMM